MFEYIKKLFKKRVNVIEVVTPETTGYVTPATSETITSPAEKPFAEGFLSSASVMQDQILQAISDAHTTRAKKTAKKTSTPAKKKAKAKTKSKKVK